MAKGMGFKDAQSDWFDTLAYSKKVDKARSNIDRETARIVVELAEAREIPSWVLRHLDLDFIKMAV
jgi:hypothetical protein